MSVADWRKVGSRVRGSESGTGGIIYRRPVIPFSSYQQQHWQSGSNIATLRSCVFGSLRGVQASASVDCHTGIFLVGAPRLPNLGLSGQP